MRKIKRRTRDSKDEWKKVRLKLEDEGKDGTRQTHLEGLSSKSYSLCAIEA
jgi:hypothetical protein